MVLVDEANRQGDEADAAAAAAELQKRNDEMSKDSLPSPVSTSTPVLIISCYCHSLPHVRS